MSSSSSKGEWRSKIPRTSKIADSRFIHLYFIVGIQEHFYLFVNFSQIEGKRLYNIFVPFLPLNSLTKNLELYIASMSSQKGLRNKEQCLRVLSEEIRVWWN